MSKPVAVLVAALGVVAIAFVAGLAVAGGGGDTTIVASPSTGADSERPSTTTGDGVDDEADGSGGGGQPDGASRPDDTIDADDAGGSEGADGVDGGGSEGADDGSDAGDDNDSHGANGSHGAAGQWVMVGDESATYADAVVSTEYWFFDPDDHNDPTWGRSRIGWLVECDSVGFAQVDPIVAPRAAQSAHLHEFFGNPDVTEHSTTQQLAEVALSQIACTDVNDKSGYWSPAVFQDGERLEADGFKAYYKSTTPDTVPMPLGLRMVAGDAGATANQSRQVGWWEQQRTNDLIPVEDLLNTRDASSMIERTDPSVSLVLRINFPNCWDGEHLDSPDHVSHMAYFDEGSKSCPATHPVKVPQLVTFTRYDAAGGAGFSLASGEWFTFHQDFWNAWSPDQLDELNDRCIVAEMNCRARRSPALERLGQVGESVPAR